MANPTIGANTIATVTLSGAEVQKMTLVDGVAGTLIAGGANGLQVELKKSTPTSGRATTGVTLNAASVTLLAANANRRKFSICNNGNQNLHIAFASSASVASGGFGMILLPTQTYLSEEPVDPGLITGIWAAAGSGYANITEWT